MNPSSTLRFRRAIAVVALLWALFAIVLSMGPLRVPAGGVQHPMRVSVLGGSVIVEGLGPSLSAAGTEVAPGDRLLELNGQPFLLEYRRGPGWLQAGVPNTYRLEKRDGRRYSVELLPEPMEAMTSGLMVLLHGLLLMVAVIYIATGGVVWWIRRDRPGAWALLLFCSAMSVQLAQTIQGDMIRWSWQCLTVNLPFIGATTFHLFTTYPIEPGWIVRHRRIQGLPYAAAFLLGS